MDVSNHQILRTSLNTLSNLFSSSERLASPFLIPGTTSALVSTSTSQGLSTRKHGGRFAVRPLRHQSPDASPMLHNLVMALCVFGSKTFISRESPAAEREVSPKESIESVPVVSLTQHDPSQEFRGCTGGASSKTGSWCYPRR